MTVSGKRPAAVLVAMEARSAWPAWVAAFAGADMMVVAQTADESSADFLAAVARRLSVLEKASRRAAVVVFCVSPSPAADRQAARWAVVQRLLIHLRGGPGSLVLACRERTDPAARSELLELAGAALRSAGVEPGVSIRVRFGPEAQGGAPKHQLVHSAAVS